MANAPKLATFPNVDPAGSKASLRVVLPPNLEAAAGRDAIAVRFEIEIGGCNRVPVSAAPKEQALAVEAAHLGAAFLLESWNSGKPAPFAQLTREQLATLVSVLADEPAFFFANQPTVPVVWKDGKLVGVSKHLEKAKPKELAATVTEPEPVNRLAAIKRAAAKTDLTPPTLDGSDRFLAIQLPSREHPVYEQLLELLKAEGFRLEPSNRKWWLRDRHKTLSFLSQYWSTFEKDWDVEFTENFRRNTAKIKRAEISCDLQASGDEFELTVGLNVGGASDREINDSILSGRPYVESGGELYIVDRESLEKLHDAQRAFAETIDAPLLGRSRHHITRHRVTEADELISAISPNTKRPAIWRRRTEAFRNISKLPPAPAPKTLHDQMRPYQRLGAAWLWHLHESGLGGILADEMGLGKTLQALALVSARHETNPGRPCLIVCPASLMENWRREAARFAPNLRVAVHHGTSRTKTGEQFLAVDMVVTSYGTLTRDRTLFEAADWDTLIADEAQHAKNRRSQNAKALQAVPAKGHVMLTGTPVENSLGDLESLFAVILPGYLKGIPGDARSEDRKWHEARLRRQAAPYILRRTKGQVTPELPEKIEQTVFVELTERQRAFYEKTRATTESELMKLESTGQSENRIRMTMFTQLLRLRQICGDPRLLDAERSPAESAKLAALFELLDEAIDDGHRVLVFSQFTSLLALVRAELDARETQYCHLDGSMPTKARQIAVDSFNETPEIPVFLLSLKAGGTGLNLATADTVIHLDPWWNPAVEAQATDRAHRIGQTRIVTSYKLIAAGTVEERVLNLQQEKRALLANVFDESDAANAALTLADLKSLVAE